jgi:hypothetical protein
MLGLYAGGNVLAELEQRRRVRHRYEAARIDVAGGQVDRCARLTRTAGRAGWPTEAGHGTRTRREDQHGEGEQ